MTGERQEDTSWSDRNALHLDGGRSYTDVHTHLDKTHQVPASIICGLYRDAKSNRSEELLHTRA